MLSSRRFEVADRFCDRFLWFLVEIVENVGFVWRNRFEFVRGDDDFHGCRMNQSDQIFRLKLFTDVFVTV